MAAFVAAKMDTDVKMQNWILCALVGAVAGCTWSLPLQEIGPDTYQARADARPSQGGVARAQEKALANANRQCEALGKRVNVTDTETLTNWFSTSVAIVTFTCQ
ncbi:MAG TPA: hypothetical protein VF851_06695 [Steroidobacteraceae bacterium]